MIDYKGLQEELYKAIDGLYVLSSDYYRSWARQVAQRELARMTKGVSHRESTRYELRVEFNGSGFAIYWYEITFVKTSSRVIRLAKMISAPESGAYKKESFKHASEWELQLILNAEEYLAPVRNQLKNLLKAHRSILFAARAGGNKLTAVPIKNRVEKIQVSVQKLKKQLS